MDCNTYIQEMNDHYYRANCYHTMRDPDQDVTSGNHHVLNATHQLIALKMGCYVDQVNMSRDFVRELNFDRSCEVEPGLYNRHPLKAADQQTHDDNIGLSVSGKILNLSTGELIAKFGHEHWWYFDNLKGKFSLANWQGRFTWLVAILKRGGKKELNWFDRLSYCGYLYNDIWFNKNPTDTSGRILQWLGNSIMKGESPFVDRCINRWEDNIKKVYPSGQMGEVMGIYHGNGHPFSIMLWDKI